MDLTQWRGVEVTQRTILRLVLAVPIVLLTVSFVAAPYISELQIATQVFPSLPTLPILLYRHEHTTFFYTSADLLHPEVFGMPAQYIEAVIFDIWPAGEGGTRNAEELTWVVRIWNAIKGEPEWSKADVNVAERFRTAVGGQPKIDRGKAILFELPQGSTYHQRSGIKQLAALGIRIPASSTGNANGTPQLFSPALEHAFRELRRTGVRSVGVPRMIARTTIGEEGSRTASWQVILRETDKRARTAGIRTVLFGGWGSYPEARQLTDTAFRTAWESHRREIGIEAKSITHERLRLGVVIVFVALLRWHFRRRELHWGRVLALTVLAAGFSLTLAEGARWLVAATDMRASLTLGVECVVAIGVEAAIEQIVRFDPKKIIGNDETEKRA